MLTHDNLVSWFRLREERRGNVLELAKKGVVSASSFRSSRRQRWGVDETFLKSSIDPTRITALGAPPAIGKRRSK